MDDKFYVANFTLNEGRINKACVWFGKETLKGVDLEMFKDAPMKLKDLSDNLHVQNSCTSIVINSEDIEWIDIYEIIDSEWR